MSDEKLLRVENVHKSFGGLQALAGVWLNVDPGMIVGLVGPNGSGKTTLFNCVTGFSRPDHGRVVFDGEDITRWSADRIARRGLMRTFQTAINPKRLTVMENLLLAPPNQVGESILRTLLSGRRIQREEEENLERAWHNLRLVRLEDQADTYAGDLSGGQKKLLMLGQALMLRPKLVLLDEPVAGVNPRLIDDIVQTIRELQSQGQNFLVVEHNMSVVRKLCDMIYVLDAGQVIASGPTEETLKRDDVLRAYLARRAS